MFEGLRRHQWRQRRKRNVAAAAAMNAGDPIIPRRKRVLIVAFAFVILSLHSIHNIQDRVIENIIQSFRIDTYNASEEPEISLWSNNYNRFLEPIKLAPWDAVNAVGGHDAIESSCQSEIVQAGCQGELPLYSCLMQHNTSTWLSSGCKEAVSPCKTQSCERVFEAFKPALNQTEVQWVEDLLQRIHNACHGIQYWMAAGSSIGSLYHFSRIPWDDDFDMYIEKANIEKAVEQMIKAGLGVRRPHRTEQNHPFYQVYDPNRPRIKDDKRNPHSYPFIDLFPIECDKKLCIEKNDYAGHGGDIQYKKALIFPLRWRPFGRLSLPFPNKLLDIVENRYGKNAKKICMRHAYNHKIERFRGQKHHLEMNCSDLPLPPPLVETGPAVNVTQSGRSYNHPWEEDLPGVTVEHLMDGKTRLSSVIYLDGDEIRRSYADGLLNDAITFHFTGMSIQPLLVPFLQEERDSYARNAAGRTSKELNLEIMPMLNTPEVGNDYVDMAESPSDSLMIRLRVGEWNAERGGNWDLFPEFFPNADIIILNEMDWGMARSGNVHTIRSMSKGLQLNYAYGVEFLELTNGNAKEIEATEGKKNLAGYHGNAVLSRWPISDATIVRLHPLYDKLYMKKDQGMDQGERRLGGRMALFATTHIGNDDILLVSVHSHAGSKGNLFIEDAHTVCNEIKRRNATNVLLGGDTGPPFTNTLVSNCGFHPLEKTNKRSGRRFQPTWRVDCPDGGPPRAKFQRGDWLLARGPGFPLLEAKTSLSVFYPYRKLENGKHECISDHAMIAMETDFIVSS